VREREGVKELLLALSQLLHVTVTDLFVLLRVLRCVRRVHM